ncbi:hypothetical protein P43SY_007577 [Pythium insidiosum]|uniref:Uncharacterized protein n=1 Tax=Pythium insidiosum TaxID=114742 RepID=A0AAD5LLX8_PYTIN|nr:hypothetical protein P43SY_007577 [Pythium insidiosum]
MAMTTMAVAGGRRALGVALRQPARAPWRRELSTASYGRRRRSIMLFASEVPVVCAMNPYRKIEELFLATWKRTHPRQLEALQQELAVVVETPEEKVRATVEQLGATAAIEELLAEASSAETTTAVAAASARLVDALPETTPEDVKSEVVQFFASEMNKGFGAKQEAPALLKYEQEQRVSVADRNLVFFKKKVAAVGAYDVLVGGKIDGRAANGKVIEVKNRLKRFMTPLPKYDLAQLQTYLFILDAQEGELVEHLRRDSAQPETRLHRVTRDEAMWATQIEPFVVRYASALAHFMQDRDAQVQFLEGDAAAQREVIRRQWMKDVETHL